MNDKILNNQGIVALPLILFLVTILGGGVFIYKQTHKDPALTIPPGVTQSNEQEKVSSPEASITKTSSAGATLKPTTSIPSETATSTGLQVNFDNTGDVLVVRLFDSDLRFISDLRKGSPYIFKNIAPGKYIVGAVGSNYYNPQAVTVSAGKITGVTLSRNNNAPAISFLKGRTFVDSNGNKKYDDGELSPEGGVILDINLITKEGDKRISGLSGTQGGPYDLSIFDYLLGNYRFSTGLQPGYTASSFTRDIGLYNTSATVDVPYTTQSTISTPGGVKGKIYFDGNGNQQLDGGENRPSDYYPSIGLEKPNHEGGYRYGSVTVSEEGEYNFSNLTPGKYMLKLDEVPGYSPYQSSLNIEIISGQEQQINFGLKR